MKNLLQTFIFSCLVLGFLSTANAGSTSIAEGLELVTQKLVAPPFIPGHEQVATGKLKIAQVRMVVERKLMDVGPNGAKIWAMMKPGPISQ